MEYVLYEQWICTFYWCTLNLYRFKIEPVQVQDQQKKIPSYNPLRTKFLRWHFKWRKNSDCDVSKHVEKKAARYPKVQRNVNKITMLGKLSSSISPRDVLSRVSFENSFWDKSDTAGDISAFPPVFLIVQDLSDRQTDRKMFDLYLRMLAMKLCVGWPQRFDNPLSHKYW